MTKMPEHIQKAIDEYKNFLLKQYQEEYPESFDRVGQQSKLAIKTVNEFLKKKQEFSLNDIIDACGCRKDVAAYAVKVYGNRIQKTQRVVNGKRTNFWSAT